MTDEEKAALCDTIMAYQSEPDNPTDVFADTGHVYDGIPLGVARERKWC